MAPSTVQARLSVHPSGYGFAERLDGEGTIFIAPGRLGIALDGDEVNVRFWQVEKGWEGSIDSIVRRGRTRITGMLSKRGGGLWGLEVDDPRILLPVNLNKPYPSPLPLEDVVVAAIDRYPEANQPLILAHIERVLGPPNTIATEQSKILLEQGIDPYFASEVLAEAATLAQEPGPTEIQERSDLRHLPFMTIDPVDARDFDDAICLELLADDVETADMRIHVAVADVSHYVREGSLVDQEAILRCFSTYLPNQAIPMLPESLSTHVCSLVPKRDRLAMVVSMRLNVAGDTDEIELREAVIHSRERLTYTQVAEILQGQQKLEASLRNQVWLLRKAADRLRAKRLRRGAIELDLPETKVVLDEDDPERIRDIMPARSTPALRKAYNLIEEFMLAANEATALMAVEKRLPMIYRIHDKPDEDKLEQLAAATDLLGISANPEKLATPRGTQKFLTRTKHHQRKQTLNMLMLRSMAQAEYSEQNIGHFALASDAYIHFTSPIRRYPDLLAHRMLKKYIQGQKPAYPEDEVRSLAFRASSRERAVMQAERDSRSLYAAAFMRDRIGDRFEGIISGLSTSGLFVLLDYPSVDGMIRLGSLEKQQRERFTLEENGIRMLGQRSGHCFTLGDRLMVEVIDVSLQRRRIELAYVARLSDA